MGHALCTASTRRRLGLAAGGAVVSLFGAARQPTDAAKRPHHHEHRNRDRDRNQNRNRHVKPDCPTLPNPNQFGNPIDNRYLPWVAGTTFVYAGTEEGQSQHDTVTVTTDPKAILGVNVTVVRDTVTDSKGNLLEDTFDWYAQDTAGNVWYFGEDTKEYKNGKVVSTEGSWEAGQNGAHAGIIMLAHPHVGTTYGQECAPGVAEDRARIFQVGASVTVPFGAFTDVLVTEEFSLLE